MVSVRLSKVEAAELTFPCIISLMVRVTLESSSWREGLGSTSMLKEVMLLVSRGMLAA